MQLNDVTRTETLEKDWDSDNLQVEKMQLNVKTTEALDYRK